MTALELAACSPSETSSEREGNPRNSSVVGGEVPLGPGVTAKFILVAARWFAPVPSVDGVPGLGDRAERPVPTLGGFAKGESRRRCERSLETGDPARP